MYAIVKTGGKQYRVAPEDIIRVEKLNGEPGDVVVLEEVLMVSTDAGTEVGAPLVEGAAVSCEIVEQGRGKKIIIFKKKRRKHYRRKRGHRQHFTALKVLEILTGGKKPSVKPTATKAGSKAASADDADTAGADTGATAAATAAAAEATAAAAGTTAAGKGKATAAEKADKAADDAAAGADQAASGGQSAPAANKNAKGEDDLSLLSGVGPVLEKKLRDAGITTFRQIAELTPEAAKELDEKLQLRGRIEREEWIEQAKELMAGKPPRAKVDQKKAAQNEKKGKN